MPYTPPVGFGLWVPTSPATTPPAAPFWGNDRRIIANSGDNDAPGAPIPYSEDPGSDFYKEVNDLYQASKGSDHRSEESGIVLERCARRFHTGSLDEYYPAGHQAIK